MTNHLQMTDPTPSDPLHNPPSNSSNLGRYFDNSTHTIFDEIFSSTSTTSPSTFFDSENKALEEQFTANLSQEVAFTSSDAEEPHYQQHRDAWIPSDQTKSILRAVATANSRSNTYNHDRENLTMPGLTLQEELADPTRKAVIHFLGEEEVTQRNVLTVPAVTHDERGLRDLIQGGCFRAAVNLTGKLIPLYGQGYGKMNQQSKHSPHSLQLWFTRLSLLAKLKLIDTLEHEAKPFGDLDKPDMYFAFYPEMYGTRRGSMASFSFRLLIAEVPYHCGRPKQSLDPLFKVLAVVRRIIKNLGAGLVEDGSGPAKFGEAERSDALQLWIARQARTLVSILNCALSLKNYTLAFDLLEQLQNSSLKQRAPLSKAVVVSAIGRLHLVLGDVAGAEEKFAEARRLVLEEKPLQETAHELRELVDRGLTAIAQNAFQEALDSFNSAMKIDPMNVMLANNIAVALLYTGKLETALRLIESSVARNPGKGLQESVLLNMCTLYELHTSHNKQSKLHLLRQINRYKGDALDIGCLKLVIT